MRALHDYLAGFMRRTQPLLDLQEVVGPEAEGRFDGLWKEGRVPGWPLEATGLLQQQQQQQGGEGGEAAVGGGAPRCVLFLKGGMASCRSCGSFHPITIVLTHTSIVSHT